MDWTSDSNDEFSWDSDDNDPAGDPEARIPREPEAAPGPSDEAGPSRPSLVTHFLGMGFPEAAVERAIKEHEEGDAEAILETLLTYAAIERSPSEPDKAPILSSSDCESSDDDFSFSEDFGAEEFVEDISERDRKLLTLVEMGFPIEAASLAINRCGQDASISDLADFIDAARIAEESDDNGAVTPMPRSVEVESCIISSHIGKKRKRPEETRKYNKKCFPDWKVDHTTRKRPEETRKYNKKCFPDWKVDNTTGLCSIPKPMVGYGLPFEPTVRQRKLPEAALGPPFFYYENVALAPKGVWETISRFLYDIEPEFVDSKYFCAAARKRGYIHNLPINKRFPLRPLPPKTIHDALPDTEKWWPSWDERTQLNCLQTCIASAQLTERIRKALASCDGPPPTKIQKYVLKECKKWNLVWVGPHKLAPLEPDEIEQLLGFPKNHTRGGGISRTDRYKSLGNSFQVDTVAFHLSVLKDMFPNGMTVLSLFTGIGGAEVALHRLGIPLKAVISIEISEVNRNILRGWWEQNGQKGDLIEVADVQQVNGDWLDTKITEYGGFDLVIGGSPCNNLAGSNRHHRDGLEGKHSSLFYDYFRILDHVRCAMGKK